MALIRRELAIAAGLLMMATGLVAPQPFLDSAAAEPMRTEIGSDFNGDGYADLASFLYDPEQAKPSVVVITYGSARGLRATGRHRLVATDFDSGSSPAYLGGLLTTGDFDADGYADLVLAGERGPVNGRDEAGSVRIVYGARQGLDLQRTQVWTRQSARVPGATQAPDAFGASVTVGDYGRGPEDDLAVSSRGGPKRSGDVTVIYGSVNGLQAAGSQQWTADSPGVPGRADWLEDFGLALASGRFSSSGYADLVIGAPGRRLGRTKAAGAVVVLRGTATGLTASGAREWSQNSAGIAGRSETWDNFGKALVVGRFGRSAHDDLVIAVPYEKLAGEREAGAVNVVFGSVRGLSAAGDQMRSQRSRGIRGVPEADDHFGEVLTGGDVISRGGGQMFDDLVVGVPRESRGEQRLGVGRVHVLRGGPKGFGPRGNLVLEYSRDVPVTAGFEPAFGFRLATGTFTGATVANLVVQTGGEVPSSNLVLARRRGEPTTTLAQVWSVRALGEAVEYRLGPITSSGRK